MRARLCVRLCAVSALALVARGVSAQQPILPQTEHAAKPPPIEAVSKSGSVEQGVFEQHIPFEIPPGRRAMQPEISLRYVSGGPNSVVGVGWSLDGIPAIVRVNTGGGIRYTAVDSFAVIRAWGESPAIDARLELTAPRTYHTARDDRRRYVAFTPGTCGSSQPCYFEVSDGRGRTYYFGIDPGRSAGGAAPVIYRPGGGPEIFAWGLSRVVDDHGNGWEVRYYDAPGNLYPESIRYTLPDVSGSGLHSVSFDYVERPDPIPAPSSWRMILKTVTVRSNGAEPISIVSRSNRGFRRGYISKSENSGRSTEK